MHRPDGVKGWVKLPKRWVIERSIGWMGRNRRRSRDDERTTGSSGAWVEVGAIGGMLRRLAPDPIWRSAAFKHPETPPPQAA